MVASADPFEGFSDPDDFPVHDWEGQDSFPDDFPVHDWEGQDSFPDEDDY